MFYLEVPKKLSSYEFLKYNIKDIFKVTLNNYINTKNTKAINNYIEKTYKTNLNFILNLIIKNIFVSENKNSNIIFIRDNIKVNNNFYLKELLSLLEFGNREVRGLGILTETFNYLKRNLYYFHLYYTLKNNN